MLSLTSRLRDAGVIGINWRNRNCVMVHNPRRLYRFVDDKVLTKHQAIKAGIAVPELYGLIRSVHEGRYFERFVEGKNDFVIKPAHGSGGNGIMVIARRRNQLFYKQDGLAIDADSVRSALEGQEVVYNFAGLADLDEAHDKPVETTRINVLGNTGLLDAAVQAGVKRYVFASTIYVSGDAGGFYRASKQACELFIEEYQRWHGLDYTILRYGSIYGRRADRNNGVLRYLRQALEDRKITVHGSGEDLREYVHVSDVARLSVEILKPEFRNQQIVLTGHHPLRVKDLMEMIREILGETIEVEYRPVDASKQLTGKTPHYAVTPYTFRPKLARKLVSQQYVDMGQGLIDCLEELQAQREQIVT